MFFIVIKHLTRKNLRKKELFGLTAQWHRYSLLWNWGGWSVAPLCRKHWTDNKLAKLESLSTPRDLLPPPRFLLLKVPQSSEIAPQIIDPALQQMSLWVFFLIPATAVYTYMHMSAVFIGIDFYMCGLHPAYFLCTQWDNLLTNVCIATYWMTW